MSGPEDNPRDAEQDEEEQFLFAIAEMIQDGRVSLARIHLRAYIEHVSGGVSSERAETPPGR